MWHVITALAGLLAGYGIGEALWRGRVDAWRDIASDWERLYRDAHADREARGAIIESLLPPHHQKPEDAPHAK